MTRILVLGGGHQGQTVAADLRAALPSARIEVADVRAGAGTIQADLSDRATLVRLMAGCDLAVGALPSRFGFGAMAAAIEAGRNLVDLSFCPEDALSLDAEARRAGVTIIPDCGLAPGLSNLLVGRALAAGPLDRVRIRVGGFAQDPARPYGYVVTWSVDDLLEEYTRPARIVADGEIVEVPALSGLEIVDVPGVGRLESFFTDGLRTLMTLGVRDMDEMTLRWPGHVDAIRPLLSAGTFVETIRRECSADPARDLVVLLIETTRGGRREEALLVDRFDGRHTAMARTTAFTCSIVAQWVATNGAPESGVRPLEALAADDGLCRHVLESLARRGVALKV